MPRLKIIGGSNAGQTFEIDSHECVIGREAWCQVALPSRTVSRRHARIVHDVDGYFLEDLNSINGTSINGFRVEHRMRLEDGDRIDVYDTVLLFCDAGSRSGDSSNRSPPAKPTVPPDNAAPPSPEILSVFDVQNKSDSVLSSSPERKLPAILKIVRSLGSSLNVDEILNRILESLFEIFPATRHGFILQPAAVGGELSPTAIKSRKDASDTVSPIGRKIGQRVMNEGLAFLTAPESHAGDDGEADSSIHGDSFRSVICAPLLGPSKTAMGVIQLEADDRQRPFIPDDLEVLSSVAMLAGQAVENSRLHESLLELEWRRREIALAKNVQLQFLPSKPLSVSGYDFFHHYQAADSVAGDCFDYIPLPDGRLAIVQGDVSGKGIPAAMLMARICAEVRYALLETASAAEAVTRINQKTCEESAGNAFVTFVLCVLDPVNHQLIVVNAGHPQPVLRKMTGGTVEIPFSDKGGLPLGIMPNAEYVQCSMSLDPGDLVLCYTDGISEAMDSELNQYGIAPIAEVILRTNPVPKHIVQALLADVRKFTKGRSLGDDICIVCFARELSPPQ